MDDQEFVSYFVRYWNLTPTELADLLGKKRDSIYPWLSGEPKNRRPTPTDVVKQLKLIHYIWMRWQQDEKLEEELLPYQTRSIYEQVKDRREFKQHPVEPEDANSATDV